MEGVSGSASQERGSKKNSFEDLSRDELINKCKGFLTLAQKAKQAKNDMLNEIESYKLQLEKCETEKKSSQENVIALQEIVDSLTEQKLKFTTDIHTAHKQIEILNSKFENYNEKINTYKAQLIVKDNQISDIEKKLSDLDSETISLKRQNKRLLDENEQLISQLTEMETRTLEVNNIGLQQKEQLQVLEQHIQSENSYKIKIEELNSKIIELEGKIQTTMKVTDYDSKLEELTKLYETEKAKKEKANVKLKSYKDKILKCAGCINQLKNSRFILAKTVKEYSENIPKWQNDIIRASKILEDQINQLSNENMVLKEKMQQFYNEVKPNEEIDLLNSEITQLRNENELLKHDLAGKQNEVQSIINRNQTISNELSDLKIKYKQVNENLLPEQTNANYLLKEELHTMNQKIITMTNEIAQLEKTITELSTIHENLKENSKGDNVIESLNLQIKALESEKAILVKEKLNARDNVMDLEQQNKLLIEQINQTKSEITRLENQSHEKLVSEENYKKEKEAEINSLKYSLTTLQEQFDVLKKEHDDLGDLNSLLKEEVDTLKLSLEQPKDDAENLTDLNVSLQADIVKLETKLSAYKQENASLLLEIKEARAKVSDFDSIMAEYDEAKSKLAGYKTENTELLNEMKEINQVLKERGEAISKLQKAIFEMERLIETLEKDSESAKEEKEEMLKRINSLENNLKTEQTQTEKDNSMRILAEKEMLISSLRDEIERLKVQQSTVDLPNEDNMSTSTLSKADEHSRMKDLDETFEDKYSKLRIFALKLKKKLNETTSQLQRTEQDKIKLEKLLNENAATDHKSTVTSTNDHGDTVQVDDENKKTVAELEGQVKSLSAAAEESQKLVAEIESLKGELLNKSQELVNEVEAHKNTKENLEKARRDVKKKNVLSLEMEDYERSMKELTAKMEENKKKMVQMESTIDTQEGTITAMKTQIKLLEEQIRTEEAQNRTIKEELHHILEDSREKDHVLQTKNSIISKLEQDLENEKRKNEDADLEMTSLMSDKEKIIIALGEEKLELNNKLKKAEFKCSELNEKLRIINIELADLKTEYTSYKVRAQAVLRQNQTVDHSQEEQLKEETAVLKAQIETLNAKLATLQEECSMQTAEAEACRRRAAEAGGEAARAGGRTARLQADLARLAAQLDSERAQHKLQVSTLTQCYKSQIKDLEATLQKETEALRKQLILAQEIVKVANVGSLDEANHNQYLVPVIPKDDSDGDEDINVSMIPREEGEGSESAPSPPLSKSFLSGGRRSPVPLDRLLEEGVPEDEALDTAALSLTPEQEVADLRRKLQVQVQRVAHVTVLLSESERDCARLGQLADLLKAELRRVRGAAASPHNTEYMKNVTFKFLTLPPGDERGRLVPVLQKILTLTADETQKIQAIAKGLDPNPSKGWGSYLPWPGGK